MGRESIHGIFRISKRMIFASSLPIVSAHAIEVIGELSHVVGDPSGLQFAGGSTVTIHSWGTFPFSSMESMFRSCDVKILCDESPVFAPDCSLMGMFHGCRRFNQDLRWDTSNVSSMKFMFYGCRSFNQNLLWNVSNVIDMDCMFADCGSFDQDLSHWDTSKVTDMSHMFLCCRSFNQNLCWDTSKVTNMRFMFYGCASFNQNLQWDTSMVTNMNTMFSCCVSLNQLLVWDVSKVTDMSFMFFNCGSSAIIPLEIQRSLVIFDG